MGSRIFALPIAGLVIAGVLVFASAIPVAAEPARIGLVIGNGDYEAYSALPACVESSRNVANTLRGLGFQVVERQDVSSGGMGAAISDFGRRLQASPNAGVLVYFCGYAAGMNRRAFLLPVSAHIARATDVMTQGILAKALLDVLSRGEPTSGLVALDLATAPNATEPALDTLRELSAPDGVALIALSGNPPPSGPSALSVALVDGLSEPGVDSATLLASVESALENAHVRIAALRRPSVSRPLAVDSSSPPVPEPALTAPDQAGDPTEPAREPAIDAPAVGSRQASPSPSFPDEREMNESERRRVQEALARIGYYSGGIDGIFGRETRAAIRRFQHEIDEEMTGSITGAQAVRLLYPGSGAHWPDQPARP